MKNTWKLLLSLLCAAVLIAPVPGAASGNAAVTYGTLLCDMLEAWEGSGSAERVDADAEALGDEVALSIARHWKQVYLDPDYRLFLLGRDDPAQLPVCGRHAFVVLGYELLNGGMTDELKGRCDAAAAAAKAFPASLLVCSGGATGQNNPQRHTEAGLMKDYLVNECGIAAERVFTDERALTTAENAINTFVILQAQGVETMTLVTSSYHQRWGQVLYNALSAIYQKEHGYSAEIVGNFCYDIAPSNPAFRQDARIAVRQLGQILGLSSEEMSRLQRPRGGNR